MSGMLTPKATSRDSSYTALGNGGAVGKKSRRTGVMRSMMSSPTAWNPDLAQNGMDGLSALVHRISASFWLSMVLGGFVAPLGGRASNRLWQLLFLAAFTICGSACMINCYIGDPPYHMLPADMMVALVHVPGFYSIFLWRRVFSSPTSAIWSVLSGDEQHMMQLKTAARYFAPFLLPAQVATVLLVFAGYSVPTQLFVNKVDASGGSIHGDPHVMTKVHNYSMWIVIPPVVSCVVANAAFFTFFVYAMYLKVDMSVEAMREKEQTFLLRDDDEGVQDALKTLIQEDSSSACGGEAVSRQRSEKESRDVELFIEIISDDIFALQDMIDDVCALWSSLVTLFLSIAFAELLAVLYDLVLILKGDPSFELTIWVYCIDTFLVVSGLGIMTGFLVMGAILTQRMDELCIECVQVMRAARVPISKAASTYSYLKTGGRKTGLGFKVYSSRIEWSHVAAFISMVLTIISFTLTSPANASSDDGGGTPHHHKRLIFHRR